MRDPFNSPPIWVSDSDFLGMTKGYNDFPEGCLYGISSDVIEKEFFSVLYHGVSFHIILYTLLFFVIVFPDYLITT